MSQDWRNNEQRIRMREEAAPTPQPAQGKQAPNVVAGFITLCVLALMCTAAVVFLGFKEPLLGDARTATTGDTTPESQQRHLTMEEFEQLYGDWYVESWDDDSDAVKMWVYGWLDSGKEYDRKETTVRIAPEDYRAMKTIALAKELRAVYQICKGVRNQREKQK